MALYFYQAYSKEGKTVNGQIDASSLQQVKEQLSRQGLFPISISSQAQGGVYASIQRLFARKVSTKEIILFSKQLAVMLRSGVPLLQALELLTDHFTGTLQTTIIKVKDEIKEGSSLADALKKYPQTFDSTYVQLVRAGEASGKLEKILERLTELLERRAVISGKIKEALLMPAIQLFVATAVVIFLMVKVVPTLGSTFESQGKELPGPTQFLMAISNFIVNYYLFLIIFIILTIVGFIYWRSTPSGKKTIDTIILRIPYIRYFARTSAVVQFSQTLGMLLESGVNLAESLDIVCHIINNRVLADALNEARDKIIKQGKIAQYLKQTKMFPPIAIYLIQTGEQTGKLDAMLLTVASNYEKELATEIDKMTTFFNVGLMFGMAIVVGFIVISIALPLVSIGEITE
ncbi:MAG TPA: type II secretion system F family protein [Candidatus Babeliales bacterium]|nr:type II secretion system F family protein [Candidatus Babeliales bacterium]